jgi:hypothetical protein
MVRLSFLPTYTAIMNKRVNKNHINQDYAASELYYVVPMEHAVVKMLKSSSSIITTMLLARGSFMIIQKEL